MKKTKQKSQEFLHPLLTFFSIGVPLYTFGRDPIPVHQE